LLLITPRIVIQEEGEFLEVGKEKHMCDSLLGRLPQMPRGYTGQPFRFAIR
jgi:hypothetical protein